MSTGFEPSPPTSELADLPPRLSLAFAPLHKRAMGTAFGVIGGLGVATLTAFHLVFLGGEPYPVELLAQYFAGYRVSWAGVAVGAFWGFLTLFVFGWFAAFLRNLVLATLLFVARTRAELAQTRDFLDHI